MQFLSISYFFWNFLESIYHLEIATEANKGTSMFPFLRNKWRFRTLTGLRLRIRQGTCRTDRLGWYRMQLCTMSASLLPKICCSQTHTPDRWCTERKALIGIWIKKLMHVFLHLVEFNGLSEGKQLFRMPLRGHDRNCEEKIINQTYSWRKKKKIPYPESGPWLKNTSWRARQDPKRIWPSCRTCP